MHICALRNWPLAFTSICIRLPSSSRYCTSSSTAIWPSLSSWESRMRREQQRQNTVSTLNTLSLTEDKPVLIHTEAGQARGRYVCVRILSYYVIDLHVLKAGVSVNAGSGGEEMEKICLAPLGRDCRPCWESLSPGTTVGFCAVCWGRTFERAGS